MLSGRGLVSYRASRTSAAPAVHSRPFRRSPCGDPRCARSRRRSPPASSRSPSRPAAAPARPRRCRPVRRARRAALGDAASSAASASADACATDGLAVVTPALHDRHRQPGLPAVLRRERRRQQDRAVGARRPDQRDRLRERRRLRHRRAARVQPRRGHLGRRPVRECVRAGPQDLRHRPQPGLVQARAGRDRRPVDGLLLRQPVARRAGGQADRRSDVDAALKDFTFGAQVGTTSLRRDQRRSSSRRTQPQVYDTNDAAIQALSQGTIDGVVVDLPTADFITNVQLEDSTIVGQFKGGTPEYFSAVLAKDSPLTDCVDAAIDALINDGTLDSAGQPVPAVPGRRPGLRALDAAGAGRGPHMTRRRAARRRRDRTGGRSRVAHRARQHGRRLRRARLARRQRARAGRRSRPHSSTARSSAESLPDIVEAFLVNIQLFVAAEVPRPHLRPAHRGDAQPARPGLLPVPAHGDVYADVFRALPGLLVIFVLGFGIPALGLVDPKTTAAPLRDPRR